MINSHAFLIFMIGALALNLTPGPDMTFVLAKSAHRGTRAGIAAALGVGTGAIFHMMLTALGLAALFAAWPVAFGIVRLIGAGYLLWLAWQIFQHPPKFGEVEEGDESRKAFQQGLLTNILNPKVAMFFVAFLPQFVVVGGGPAWRQIVILGAAFNISGTMVNCAVAICGGKLVYRLRQNPSVGKVIGWISGSVMVGLALKLALPNRR